MINTALDPSAGKPHEGDAVWSALPDAPIIEERARRLRLTGWFRSRDAQPSAERDLGTAASPVPVKRLA